MFILIFAILVGWAAAASFGGSSSSSSCHDSCSDKSYDDIHRAPYDF